MSRPLCVSGVHRTDPSDRRGESQCPDSRGRGSVPLAQVPGRAGSGQCTGNETGYNSTGTPVVILECSGSGVELRTLK